MIDYVKLISAKNEFNEKIYMFEYFRVKVSSMIYLRLKINCRG